MRLMAWEKVKGELRSILASYYSPGNFEKMNEEVNKFIKTVEDDDLHT